MSRIVGIDVARGLAVLGMVTAHVGPQDPDRALPPGGWSQLADGRPSALFVVLAGASLALMSGGTAPVTGAAARRVRVRVVVRALVVLLLGWGLVELDTPIAVILPTYALLFAVALVPLLWSRRALLVAAGAVAVAGPLVRQAWTDRHDVPAEGLAAVLVGPYYPAVVWLAYLLAGLALGRTALHDERTRLRLAGGGLAAAVLGYAGAWAARTWFGAPERWATAAPHSSTTFEVVGNTGVALLVVAGACALAARRPRVLTPLAAVGELALTAYTGHILAIAALGPHVVREPTAGTWLAFLAVTVGACWAWRTWLGRGPLERLMHALSTRLARP